MPLRSCLSLTLLLGILLIAGQVSHADTTYVSGTQSGTWNPEGSPYLVTGNITVPDGQILTIEAGVEVLFQGELRIYAGGSTIEALGTESDSVIFKPAPGYTQWGSIHFTSTPAANPNRFRFCKFDHAYGWGSDDHWGGAFYGDDNGIITAEHCSFLNCRAHTGAVIFAHETTATFSYCEALYNENDWVGGAFNFNTGTVTFDHTLMAHNISPNYAAGAVYAYNGNVNFVNCTITNNSASSGGGILVNPEGTTIHVSNSIVYGNTGGNISGGGTKIVTYSDIGGGFTGTGNINADPMFINSAADNYHLTPRSPCIDAGNPNSPLDPDQTLADMGCFYFDLGPALGTASLDLEPVNPPIVLPPQGGSFSYTATLSCDSAGWTAVDAWADLRLPDGQIMGPLFTRPDIYMNPGGSILRTLQMYVSVWAMPGTYWFRGYLGDSPSQTVVASDSFEFVKQEATGFTGKGGAYAEITGWGEAVRVDLPGAAALPQGRALSAYPNPFNPTTALSYRLQAASQVKMTVWDTAGRLISVLTDGRQEAGQHSVTFNGSGLASGVYLIRLTAGDQTQVQKIMLMK